MGKRYTVQYGLGSNIQREAHYDDQDEAVRIAEELLHYPHGYLFSFVYDNRPENSRIQLVWSYRNGYNSRYKG